MRYQAVCPASSGKTKETSVEIRASDDRPTAMHAAPPKSVRLWCDPVKSMGPDEVDSFEQETFAEWDRASFGDRGRRDGVFVSNPFDGASGNPVLRGDRARRQAGAQQLLNGMSIEHPEHPPRASPRGDR